MLWVDVTENTVIVWDQSLYNLNGFGVLVLLETLWVYMIMMWDYMIYDVKTCSLLCIFTQVTVIMLVIKI